MQFNAYILMGQMASLQRPYMDHIKLYWNLRFIALQSFTHPKW
jgi:hypothetical protein